MRFLVSIPRRVRRGNNPAYVSAGTKSAKIIATASGQAAVVATVNRTSTCAATIGVAPSIEWTFTVELFDGDNPTGSLLSRGSIAREIVAGVQTRST